MKERNSLFRSVEAIPLSRNPSKVLVRWDTYLRGAELGDYQFFVQAGETADNEPGFQDINIYQQPLPPQPHTHTKNVRYLSAAIDGLDDHFYLDFTQNLIDLTKALSYRILCRRKSTQEDFLSEPFSVGGDLDLVGIYITEETDFELRDAIGVPCFTYKRKRDGILCTRCFDPIQKKRLISGCTSCYDTNWLGGFYDPVDSFIDFSPNLKNLGITQWGEVQENESMLRLSNFPILYPGDVIRELAAGRMWRVVKVKPTEKRRVLALQFPIVTEIKPSDIEYKIPFDEQPAAQKVAELDKIRRKREF